MATKKKQPIYDSLPNPQPLLTRRGILPNTHYSTDIEGMTPPKMYPCSYQWDISNLSVTPLVPGKSFVSPCFTADVLGNTRWNLWFYPKGKDHPRYMGLFLQRCEDDESPIEEVFVNVRLLVESHAVRFCRMKVMQSARFVRGQVVGFTRLALSDSLHLAERDWPYDNFLITCEMSLSDQVAVDDPRWNPRTDLRCLSEDARRLLQFGLHHDLLITSQGSEFKAHRAVLASRSPFFKQLLRHNTTTSLRLDMSDVSPDVLARLLTFIYSGVVDDGGWSQLMEAARHFRMGDLVRRLVTFPKSFVALTQIEVDNMFVVWSDPFNGPPKFKSTFKSSKPYCSQLHLLCQFVWDDCRGNGDYVNLAIRLAGVRTNVPVFILVYVQLYDGEELLMELHACHHILEDDSWWEQSFPVEDLRPEITENNKDYRLLFEVNMCAGTHASFIREEVPQNQEERVPVAMDDFRQNSDDFSGLLSEGTFSDFTIACGEVEFKAHRCILASRSPVFRSMLEHNMLEKVKNRVHIDDIRPQVMQTLLQYLYSGVLPDNLHYPNICELYEAADKYAVHVLKDRCGCLLVEKLDPVNVELVLRLSDLHCDKVLLCRVKNYVRDSHQRGALNLTKDGEEPAVYL